LKLLKPQPASWKSHNLRFIDSYLWRPCDCSYSIFARSTSAVTTSEKSSLTRVGSLLCTFQWA